MSGKTVWQLAPKRAPSELLLGVHTRVAPSTSIRGGLDGQTAVEVMVRGFRRGVRRACSPYLGPWITCCRENQPPGLSRLSSAVGGPTPGGTEAPGHRQRRFSSQVWEPLWKWVLQAQPHRRMMLPYCHPTVTSHGLRAGAARHPTPEVQTLRNGER